MIRPTLRSAPESKLLLRGIHFELNDATRALIETKAERLFRHESDILRLRVDVEREIRGRTGWFTAKARLELAGPDLTASVRTDSALTSVTLLIDKLDRMLRKRASNLLRRRNADDIRVHATAA
jgi:Ribosome-associated protein Y (PSrp-1)